ncbi:unnamed protein product [Allacma fusca]|uniref:Uncharacterized protein n=1 Tax=Allacma fusca TaxID=39272 RepID=A0A8J2PBX9_9HEXA|nr:unnamed protein product [Allacma fusca]
MSGSGRGLQTYLELFKFGYRNALHGLQARGQILFHPFVFCFTKHDDPSLQIINKTQQLFDSLGLQLVRFIISSLTQDNL